MAPWVKVLVKVVTVVPSIIDGGKFVVAKIKQRRKARLTEREREQAMEEAKERLDRILDAAKKAK